jgi:hypothetical protein
MPVKIEIEYDENLVSEEAAALRQQEDFFREYLAVPLDHHDGKFRWIAMVDDKSRTLLSLQKITGTNEQIAYTTEKELKRDPAEIHWGQYPAAQSFTRRAA